MSKLLCVCVCVCVIGCFHPLMTATGRNLTHFFEMPAL